MKLTAFVALCSFMFLLAPYGAHAQKSIVNKPSETVATHARQIAPACIGSWEAQGCLKAVSESLLVMAANYAGTLQSKKLLDETEQIKQHCAAGTAATRGEYPAYAMKSAWIECANTIYDVSEATGLKPDASHYQLLVGPVLCLEKDRRCAAVENGLRVYQ